MTQLHGEQSSVNLRPTTVNLGMQQHQQGWWWSQIKMYHRLLYREVCYT